jgi:hypothetical protein
MPAPLKEGYFGGITVFFTFWALILDFCFPASLFLFFSAFLFYLLLCVIEILLLCFSASPLFCFSAGFCFFVSQA